MKPIEYVGIAAMVIGIIHTLPQIYKIHKSGNVSSYSIYSVYLSLLSFVLWLIFEFYKKEKINFLSTLISFVIELWILTKIKG